MPISRFNSTGRKRILQKHVHITFTPEKKLSFTARLELDSYSLPHGASVRVEAHRGEIMMRCDIGTVGKLADVTKKHALDEFASARGLLFRILVIEPGAGGRLLAASAPLRASGDRDQATDDTLLPVEPGVLGQEAWRIELREDGAHLVVNQNLGDWEGFAVAPSFRALVYPAALRYVLRRIEELPEGPAADWLQLARTLGVPKPADAGDDWIDDAARAFADQHQLLDGLRRAIEHDLEET